MRKKTLTPVGEEFKNPNLSDAQRDLLADDEAQQRIINEQLRMQDEMDEGRDNKPLEQPESVDEMDFVEAAYTGHSYDGRVSPKVHAEDAEKESIGSAFIHGVQRGATQSVSGASRDGRLAALQERLSSAAAKENVANAEFANREPEIRHRR